MVSIQFSSPLWKSIFLFCFLVLQVMSFLLLYGFHTVFFLGNDFGTVFSSFRDVSVQFSSPSGNGFSAVLFFFRQEMVSVQFSSSGNGFSAVLFFREWFQCSSLLQGMVSVQFSSSGNGFSAVLFFREWFQCSSLLQGMVSVQFSSLGKWF